MKKALLAVIIVAVHSYSTSFAESTVNSVDNKERIIMIFVDAINNIDFADANHSLMVYEGSFPQQSMAGVPTLIRLVINVEAFRFLLDFWDHIVNNWEFYRSAITKILNMNWLSSCTPHIPKVLVDTPFPEISVDTPFPEISVNDRIVELYCSDSNSFIER